jgi:hypothetical protein
MPFIGTCVDNPFKSVSKLTKIIDSGKEISKATFLKHCEINKEDSFGTISFSVNKKEMSEYPNDFEYYHVPKTNIYFFTNSAVEFFFIGDN